MNRKHAALAVAAAAAALYSSAFAQAPAVIVKPADAPAAVVVPAAPDAPAAVVVAPAPDAPAAVVTVPPASLEGKRVAVADSQIIVSKPAPGVTTTAKITRYYVNVPPDALNRRDFQRWQRLL
jgi:hypothetical protein